MLVTLKFIIKNHWKKISVILFLQIISIFSQFMSVYIMGLIFSKGVKNSNLLFVEYYGVIMLIFLLVTISCLILINYLSISVASDSAIEIRKRLYNIYHKLPLNEIIKYSSTDLMARSTRGVYNLRTFIFSYLTQAIIIPLIIIGLFFDYYEMNSFFGLVFTVFFVIMAIFLIIVTYYACNEYFDVKKSLGGVNFIFRQGALFFNNSRLFNKLDYEKEVFSETADIAHEKNLKFLLQTGYIPPLFVLAINMFLLLILYCSSFMIQDINLDMIDLVMNFQYLLFLITSLKALPQLLSMFFKVNAANEKIEEVFALENLIMDKEEVQTDTTRNIVEFHNVSFGYSEKAVLKNLTFDVERSSTVAMVGKVASGKTTILSLISGLYHCNEGEILLDGINIKDLPKDFLREKISIATQKNFLINDTVNANISFGDESITEEVIKEVSKITLLDECEDNIHKNLGYELYENASNISERTRQRINITRCLVQNVELYLFDDVLYSYPNQSEVFKNIKEYLKSKTIIIATDNVEILKEADNIILLENNTVSHMGTHDELLSESEYYRKLCQIQGEN